MVIIGNEHKDKTDNSGSIDQDEIKSDLYIVLAALELDTLMKRFIKSLEDARISDYKLPFIIQEVYNPANMTFLSDKYMSSSQKLWNSMNQRMPAAIIPGYKMSTTHYDLPPTMINSPLPGNLTKSGSYLKKVSSYFVQILLNPFIDCSFS